MDWDEASDGSRDLMEGRVQIGQVGPWGVGEDIYAGGRGCVIGLILGLRGCKMQYGRCVVDGVNDDWWVGSRRHVSELDIPTSSLPFLVYYQNTRSLLRSAYTISVA